VSSTPPTDPFVPPPPPTGSSLYPPEVLARQATYAASEAKTALVLSILGVFCFGFIFGLIAFRKANTALETINTYGVAEDKRPRDDCQSAQHYRYRPVGRRPVGENLRFKIKAASTD
jgi:hypothetical protein